MNNVSKLTSQWRQAGTWGAVGKVTEPDISVTFEMKHLTAVVASYDRQVAISNSPRIFN